MSSQRKIDANRANAAKSTGPKTADGKAISRANAYKHGMRSRTVVIPGENEEEYDRLRNGMCEEFEPRTRHEEFLVKQMADAMWRLDRLKGIESALYAADEIDPAELDRISQWQVRMENSYHKAYKLLQVERKARTAAQTIEEKERQEELAKKPRTIVLYWKDENGNPVLAPGFTEELVQKAKDEFRELTGLDPELYGPK